MTVLSRSGNAGTHDGQLATPPRPENFDSYQRHLVLDHAIEPTFATDRERFEAIAALVRERIVPRWLETQSLYDAVNPKRIYYLSLEVLPGKALRNYLLNLHLSDEIRELAQQEGFDLDRLAESEPDAGLGNGGLGRLFACFLDSLSTLSIPAMGYALRYEFGIFRQDIENGFQVEHPDNWLRVPDPWETARLNETVETSVACTLEFDGGLPQLAGHHSETILGVPYDRPVVGYDGSAVNTLRLWRASSPDYFDLDEFNHGDFFGAVHKKVLAATLTRVLYPDDSTSAGRHLRFLQEYFLVACSLADIIRRFRAANTDWHTLPDKVAIQLNDTHPSTAVAELMRFLLDEARLGWEESWDITVRTLAYTNHTLLPEALERWPVELFEMAMPRHLEIIYEINRRFLADVGSRYQGDTDRVSRMSLIEEGAVKQVRMAHLAIVGTHSTNGVAAVHSELLRTSTVKDFGEMFPERFNNKTNGVTPRRWLMLCNPGLAGLITEAIGDGWIADLGELRELLPLASDSGFQERFRTVQRQAKARLADWVKSSSSRIVDPDSLFDTQVKRIHEYKRQLLNLLHIVILYDRIRRNPQAETVPRTFFFAGKAAPAYQLAKLIIKLINNVAEVIDADSDVRGRINVIFLANYDVSLAQRLIPASDVSEQISTAGYEASGTSNMKLMMNGALTVGTRDGATIEMAQEAGEDNFFLFGLTARQVAESRGWYDPRWHYEHDEETRRAIDLISSNHFSRREPNIFAPIIDRLLNQGDYFMHLADLTAYANTQAGVGELYRTPNEWTRKAIINTACSGKFSSDRAIREYASDIWKVAPCPVPPENGQHV